MPAILGLWIGAISDRRNARRTMIEADIVRALLLVGFGLALLWGRPPLVALFATAAVLGFFNVVFYTAAQQAMPALLPSHLIAKGNSQVEALRSGLAEFFGPMVGSALFSAGRAVPFLGDAASFVGSAAFLSKLPSIPPPPRPKRHLRVEVREGARFALRSPALRTAIFFVASAAFCQSMVFAVQVLYLKDLLGYSNTVFGVTFGLAGIGNVIGNLTAERLIGRFGAGLAMFVAATAGSVTYGALSGHLPGWAVVGLFVTEALFLGVGLVASMTIRQTVTPAEYRGRVGGFARTLSIGSASIGALVGGAVAELASVRVACFIAGLLGLAAAASFGPAMRRNLRRTVLATAAGR